MGWYPGQRSGIRQKNYPGSRVQKSSGFPDPQGYTISFYILIFDFQDWQFVQLGEQQNFGIKTAGLEDKATACQMLVCYARSESWE